MVDKRVVRGAAAVAGGAVGLVAGGPAGAVVGGAAAERGAKHLIDRRQEHDEQEKVEDPPGSDTEESEDET
jgi:hypothetical protein